MSPSICEYLTFTPVDYDDYITFIPVTFTPVDYYEYYITFIPVNCLTFTPVHYEYYQHYNQHKQRDGHDQHDDSGRAPVPAAVTWGQRSIEVNVVILDTKMLGKV